LDPLDHSLGRVGVRVQDQGLGSRAHGLMLRPLPCCLCMVGLEIPFSSHHGGLGNPVRCSAHLIIPFIHLLAPDQHQVHLVHLLARDQHQVHLAHLVCHLPVVLSAVVQTTICSQSIHLTNRHVDQCQDQAFMVVRDLLVRPVERLYILDLSHNAGQCLVFLSKCC
jgi:hypothetical protein